MKRCRIWRVGNFGIDIDCWIHLKSMNITPSFPRSIQFSWMALLYLGPLSGEVNTLDLSIYRSDFLFVRNHVTVLTHCDDRVSLIHNFPYGNSSTWFKRMPFGERE